MNGKDRPGIAGPRARNARATEAPGGVAAPLPPIEKGKARRCTQDVSAVVGPLVGRMAVKRRVFWAWTVPNWVNRDVSLAGPERGA